MADGTPGEPGADTMTLSTRLALAELGAMRRERDRLRAQNERLLGALKEAYSQAPWMIFARLAIEEADR